MRKNVIILSCSLIFLSISFSHSELLTYYRGINLDHVSLYNGNWWFPDLPLMVNMTYEEQLGFIDNLNKIEYGGITNWRLSKTNEAVSFRNAVWQSASIDFPPESFITPVISNTSPGGNKSIYWGGRVQDIAEQYENPNRAIVDFSMDFISSYDCYVLNDTYIYWNFDDVKNFYTSAWVTAPEPDKLFLIGFSFIGLFIIRRIRKPIRT